MDAYRITEWEDRYEVSYKGDIAKSGDKLRAGKLAFIRLKVHGHSQGTGFRRLKKIASEKRYEVFGIFCKFLEIAGNNKSDLRGWLLDEKGHPADCEELAFIIDAPVEQVEYALKSLSDKKLDWIELTQFRETPVNSGKIPAPLITEPNETELNTTQPNEKESEDSRSAQILKEDAESVESNRIKLYDNLIVIFKITRKEDQDAMRWVCDEAVIIYKTDVNIFSVIWELTKESTKGKKPIALFISKLKSIGIRK